VSAWWSSAARVNPLPPSSTCRRCRRFLIPYLHLSRRLWFVRFPRPPEAPSTKALELELESYITQSRLLSETLTVKKLARDAARDATRGAQAALSRTRDAFNAKMAVIAPLREALRSGGEASRKLRKAFADLPARSEAELDAKLAGLHHRIEHESIPLNEEKKLLADIKKLEAQRLHVREAEASAGAVAEARVDVSRAKEGLSEHEEELSMLRSERETQQAIVQSFRQKEDELNKEVEAAVAARSAARERQNAAYGRLTEQRRAQQSKMSEFLLNRRFSREVRQALAAGRGEEARSMCAKQTDAAVARLLKGGTFATEYFELWGQQRKGAAEREEEGGTAVPDALSAGGKKGGKGQAEAKGAAAAKEVSATEKADAVVAAVLKEASAKAATAAAEPAPAAAFVPAAAPAAVFKPRKPAPRPAAAAPPPLERAPADDFELPTVVFAAGDESELLSPRSTKAAERERARQSQLEAQKRKDKRAREKERKREKTQAAAMAAAAALEASSKAGAAVVAKPATEEAPAPKPEPAPAPAPELAAKKPVAKTAAPVAKRPVPPARRSLWRRIKSMLKSHDLKPKHLNPV
jgi:uncharacterized coiled-coil DUF342 family protein